MVDPIATPTLLQSLGSKETWIVAAVALALGAFGGIAHFGASKGEASSPRKPWGDALVGAVAAVGILFVLHPTDGVALVSASLIAGYAGRAVMAALEDKAKAIIMERQLAVERKQTIDASARAELAADYVQRLVGEVEKAQGLRTNGPLPLQVDSSLLDAAKARFGGAPP